MITVRSFVRPFARSLVIACVRACVRVCVRACVRARLGLVVPLYHTVANSSWVCFGLVVNHSRARCASTGGLPWAPRVGSDVAAVRLLRVVRLLRARQMCTEKPELHKGPLRSHGWGLFRHLSFEGAVAWLSTRILVYSTMLRVCRLQYSMS